MLMVGGIVLGVDISGTPLNPSPLNPSPDGLFSLMLWLFVRWVLGAMLVFLLVTNDSCLPVNGWCDLGNIQTTTTNNPSRMFL